jgi:peptidoglycan/xylan/chitin deacetylase (PgdA/CDA1 family)
MPRLILSLFLLFCSAIPFSAPAARSSFGSQKVLETCWTKQELAGSASDRYAKSQYRGDKSTPPPDIVKQAALMLPKLPQSRRGSIRYVQVEGGKKLIALTFDLCESAGEISGYDRDIVNYLRKHHIKATFFAGGKWMRDHEQKTMQLMADPLFEIGNHTWTHSNLRRIGGQPMLDQILWTQAEYKLLRDKLSQQACYKKAANDGNHIPRLSTAFRFPYGVCNNESLNTLSNHGLAAIQWNIVSGDPWRGQSAKSIAATILKDIRPGAIIVAHANGRGLHTAESLRLFIPGLLSKGYRFVTVSELLDSGKVVSASSCYEWRPGDNLRYDQPGRGRWKSKIVRTKDAMPRPLLEL